MAFKEVADLSADVTIALGGVNRKTNKKNPTQVEGYYLGKREVEDRKTKSGKAFIYFFQTPEGNIGVWGKTDMNRKMESATEGTMTRVTFDRMVPTPNGDMYKYKVEVDTDNVLDGFVAMSQTPPAALQDEEGADGGDDEESDDGDDEEYSAAARVSASADRSNLKNRVEELLKKGNSNKR